MDLASLFGFIVAWGLILVSLAMGAGIIGYWNLPSIVIVFGGCIGSVMMKYPFSQLKGLIKVMKNAFFKKLDSSEEIINTILLLAIEAKKTGILGLERVKVPQPFLQKGIQLAIDGVDGHPQRVDHEALGPVQPLVQPFQPPFVHQETDGAEVHAEHRQDAPRLLHEA